MTGERGSEHRDVPTPELRRARRDLAVSLALSVPGSPVRTTIRSSMDAIIAELARRGDEQ